MFPKFLEKRIITERYDFGNLYTLFFLSSSRLKLAKNQANAKQHLEVNFGNLKIIHILHPRYHPKIKGNNLKNEDEKEK